MIVWLEFLLCTAVVVVAVSMLWRYGDVIAEKSGLGRIWVGVLLIASVTSLPGLIRGISSADMFDLPDMAAGGVPGSKLFNVAIVGIEDMVYLKGAVVQ